MGQKKKRIHLLLTKIVKSENKVVLVSVIGALLFSRECLQCQTGIT